AEETVVTVYVTDGKPVSETVSELTAAAAERSVSLNWNGSDGILYYNIYKKAPLGLSKLIATVTDRFYTDTEVVTCVPFEYTVEGVTTRRVATATVITNVVASTPKRWMETLNRGAIAVKTENGIFISWRLKGYEYDKDISFIILRNGERITERPITNCTCLLDNDGKSGDEYTVKAVKDGKAEKNGETVIASEFEYLPIPIDKPEPYTTPDGNTYEYYANDVIPADLDGDGEYEFVLKWVANPKDNSHKGYTGVYYLDAYKMNGTKMWRMNLGVNIRCGAHYAQVMVYDFDNDGKAEIICKTADGTTDAQGNVVGDKNADYRNKDGFIIEGPEYLSAFDGETGTLLDTVPYDPPRGNVREWGDSWGNRVDRFLACVAYLDGVNPSAVMCRGYYEHGKPTVLAAYDLVDKKLVKKWVFRADKNQNINFTDQGNHSLGVGDVDGDGMDEIVYGAMAVDHNGVGMYSTGLGHGDAQHLGKFLPHADGLQYFEIHEEDGAEFGYEAHNPATGEILWGKFTGRDTARGMCAKVDPRYEGNQVWAIGEPLYSFDGRVIRDKAPETCKFTVWWDGDLLRELLDYIPDEDIPWNGRPKIMKWDWENGELKTVFEPIGAKA
ncbi:MAG: rhamnogalacturonan lyase, partial [Clostridia bacterium]|nr:rhamnogalacturonan lyase [Clostridia bacterium]